MRTHTLTDPHATAAAEELLDVLDDVARTLRRAQISSSVDLNEVAAVAHIVEGLVDHVDLTLRRAADATVSTVGRSERTAAAAGTLLHLIGAAIARNRQVEFTHRAVTQLLDTADPDCLQDAQRQIRAAIAGARQVRTDLAYLQSEVGLMLPAITAELVSAATR